MNLPSISPTKSPVSFTDNDASPALFKRVDAIQTPDPSPTLKYFNSEVQTVQPKYMTGYGGFQPHQDEETQLPRVISAPVVGYTGCYRGKNLGKLGRCEVHRARLSTWEKDTVSGILGVPAAHDDWEYSHYTNKCGNFADKKFQESSSPTPCISSGVSSGFLSSVASSSGGFANDTGSTSGSLVYSQQLYPHTLRSEHEETGTDRILLHILQGLETRFKTAAVARSTLKGAFFSLDRFHTGRLLCRDFFDVLSKVAGSTLSEEQEMHLAYVLSCVDRYRHGSQQQYEQDGSSNFDELQELQPPQQQKDLDYVNYGRFLNIIVPRSKDKGKKTEATEASS